MTKIEFNMRGLYDEYKEGLSALNKATRKLQKRNSILREKERNIGEDYIFNKNMIDITIMNEMSRDLIVDMEEMELYLPYEERKYLHKKHKEITSSIASQHDLYGLQPDGEIMYADNDNNTEDIVCDVVVQNRIVTLLDKVLTERQCEVIRLYFFENMTQEQIAKKMGINKQNVSVYMQNALEKLRKSEKISEIVEI